MAFIPYWITVSFLRRKRYGDGRSRHGGAGFFVYTERNPEKMQKHIDERMIGLYGKMRAFVCVIRIFAEES